MYYTPSTNTDSTKAAFGEKSTAVSDLQKAINASGGVTKPIAIDQMYGKETQGAYNSLINGGYTYTNGAFTKAGATKINTDNTGAPTDTSKNPNSTLDSSIYRPIYTEEPAVTTAKTAEQLQIEKRAAAQAQIDNLNSYYNTLRQEQNVVNEKNDRSTNAISTLTGLSGSTEADVAASTTTAGNERANKAIENERAVAIGNILSDINKSSVEEARQSRMEARQSEQDRLDYRVKAQQDAVTHLTTLSKSSSGATLEGLKATLSPEAYNYLIKNSGGESMARAILFENRAKNTVLGSPQLIGGKMVQAYTLPDGSVKYETVSLPDGVDANKIKSIEKTDHGLFIIKDDGTYSKITDSGKIFAPKKGGGGGNAPSVSEQKTAIENTLKTGVAPSGQSIGNARGADGYVDPAVYSQSYKNWGGTTKDFLNYFPVEKNVNPASYNLLPDALKLSSKTKKKGS